MQPRRGGLAAPLRATPMLLLLLVAIVLFGAQSAFAAVAVSTTAANTPHTEPELLVRLPTFSSASTALQNVVDAYAAKLSTERAALETARLNHDAKAGLRVLATGKAEDVAEARARAQAVVGAALTNAIGQRCPNGSYPIPLKQRLAAIKAQVDARKEAIEARFPTISVQIGNNGTSAASRVAALVAARVAAKEAAVLNATSPVWGPALTSFFNGVGTIGNAKIAARAAVKNATRGLLAARMTNAAAASDEVAAEAAEAEGVLFSALDLEALTSSSSASAAAGAYTDDVDGLLRDAAEAYAESLLAGGGAGTGTSTSSGLSSARNRTRAKVSAALARLPYPHNATAASIEALGAEAAAKLEAYEQRLVGAAEAKEAVVRAVTGRVWSAVDPRPVANVTTGTGCVVPPGSYVRDTVVDGYEIEECPVNSYCPGGVLTEQPKPVTCPAGTTTQEQTGSESVADCIVPPGSYLDPFGQIKVCERDFWCPGGPYDEAPTRTPCAAGNTTLGATGSSSASACQTIDPCLAPGTCCQNNQVYAGWSAATPACSQQAVPSPICVDLDIDTKNCGSCGRVCPIGTTCVGGVCQVPPGSFLDPNGPNGQPEIRTCPAESYCPGGGDTTPLACPAGTGTLGSTGATSVDECVPQDPCVPDPYTCCRGPVVQPGWPQYAPSAPYQCVSVGGLCTNTAIDKNNCGTCGNSCSAGATVSCCSGSCVDTASSATSCGACGVVCLGGSTCQAGVCTCPAGTTFSADGKSCLVPPGKTVDPNGNIVTCPADNWCPGGQYCVSGCAASTPNPCGPGLTTFGATGQSSSAACQPIDPCFSPNTCCQGSQVFPPWSPSTPQCAGTSSPSPTCSNLSLDAANCGSCGAACPSSASTCCSGSCTSLTTSTSSCGSCGNTCPVPPNTLGAACAGGSCSFTSCAAGFGNCNSIAGDGCETNLLTSSTSCGVCGNSCGANSACTGGQCTCLGTVCPNNSYCAPDGCRCTTTNLPVATNTQAAAQDSVVCNSLGVESYVLGSISGNRCTLYYNSFSIPDRYVFTTGSLCNTPTIDTGYVGLVDSGCTASAPCCKKSSTKPQCTGTSGSVCPADPTAIPAPGGGDGRGSTTVAVTPGSTAYVTAFGVCGSTKNVFNLVCCNAAQLNANGNCPSTISPPVPNSSPC